MTYLNHKAGRVIPLLKIIAPLSKGWRLVSLAMIYNTLCDLTHASVLIAHQILLSTWFLIVPNFWSWNSDVSCCCDSNHSSFLPSWNTPTYPLKPQLSLSSLKPSLTLSQFFMGLSFFAYLCHWVFSSGSWESSKGIELNHLVWAPVGLGKWLGWSLTSDFEWN